MLNPKNSIFSTKQKVYFFGAVWREVVHARCI